MNFLAHIYLSGDNDLIKIGNFIGDFVKGKELEKYNKNIQIGIKLHRHIDQYTDSHPVVFQSKKRLRPVFHHYAPVISDVFYDHFLAKNWQNYSNEPLLDYTREFYELTDKYNKLLPSAANHMLSYMKKDNWLYQYRLIEGIDRALSGMSRRTKFKSKMELAAAELATNFSEYESEFELFFPDLVMAAGSFLEKVRHD
jgi:acyl carrier protein phosphodiesterase